jgi:hypothetical protein
LLSEQGNVEFSEGGTYDFTRCVRPNGTAYGTKGKCRKGREENKSGGKPAAGKGKNNYKETPGSSKPLPKPSAEEDLKDARASLDRLQKEREGISKLDKTTSAQKARLFEIKYLLEDANRRVSDAESGRPTTLPLEEIYSKQGFNAKPELVGSRSDLEKRTDVLKQPNGENLILFRGVTNVEYADQFKGLGPDGGVHFPGKGIAGNGSYAVAPNPASPERKKEAISVAKGYAKLNEEEAEERVTAFAFRNDANVVRFSGSPQEQEDAYREWRRNILDEAESKTGRPFNDRGEAAAALGIHAYQIPRPGEDDYWVVLNRGSIIAAEKSEI